MKVLFLMIMMITNTSKADLTVNTLWKYGINGYSESGINQSSSQSTTTSSKKTTVTNTNSTSWNTLSVTDRFAITPGLGFEVSPHDEGMCVGAGYYFDNTVQMNLGWKLF